MLDVYDCLSPVLAYSSALQARLVLGLLGSASGPRFIFPTRVDIEIGGHPCAISSCWTLVLTVTLISFAETGNGCRII